MENILPRARIRTITKDRTLLNFIESRLMNNSDVAREKKKKKSHPIIQCNIGFSLKKYIYEFIKTEFLIIAKSGQPVMYTLILSPFTVTLVICMDEGGPHANWSKNATQVFSAISGMTLLARHNSYAEEDFADATMPPGTRASLACVCGSLLDHEMGHNCNKWVSFEKINAH